MKRIIDEPYATYSTYSISKSGIYVKCPKCGKRAIVTADYAAARFSCGSCGKSDSKDGTVYRCDVHNHCEKCGQYYRVDITDETKQNYPALHVACPRCGHVMQGKVQRDKRSFWRFGDRIIGGHEPWFGCELWFLDSFDGKPV